MGRVRMNYRMLGGTGLKVSELSWGAARGAKEDPEGFVATLNAAMEAGVNFIDTAEKYGEGECERLLGKALKGRSDIYIETKYLPYDSFAPEAKYTGSAQGMRAAVEGSLGRLQRDYLDVLLGHGMRAMESYDRFMEDGCYEEMVKLKRQGKVRFIGISELSEADGTHEVLKKAVPTGKFDVVMLTVNMLLQTAVEGVLPLCEKHGVGTVVMMPLNQAWGGSGLVGEAEAMECVRRHVEKGTLPNRLPYTEAGLFEFLKPWSVPEGALRYVLSQKVSSVCFGARKPGRVLENLRAMDKPYLSDGQMAEIKRLFGGIEWQVR
jgi:aryl-alcohol dehydrogenase-like predicted oxidoreductase